MDIRQLRYFLGVLEAQSITKAAETLHVAQPALGLQIRKLEEELGVTLVVRHSRGIVPTEAGRLLANHATALIQQLEAARQDLLDYSREPRGRVSIGLTTSTSMVLAGLVARRVTANLPKVRINLCEGMSERLLEWVRTEGLDIMLTFNTSGAEDLHLEPLFTERLHFVLSREMDDGNAAPISLAEALDYPLVLPTAGHLLRDQVEQEAVAQSRSVTVALEVDSVNAIMEMVKHGIGYSIMPSGAVVGAVRAGDVVTRPIADPSTERTLYLAWSRAAPPSKAVLAVASEIRALVAEIASEGAVDWHLPDRQARTAVA